MIKTIQSSQRESVIGKEEASKQLESLKDQFQREVQQITETFEGQVGDRDKEITQLTENNQKLELELQLNGSDFKKEIEILKENLQLAEEERDKLKSLSKSQES